ncbi:hypothetical protein EYC84_006557 [Monilinia fructicola]|uniref:Uncharacterized protein n=1 Tax=Monilinia fructicola TaxID=38448 RepID=A0A5M9K7F8_MONFR|nr:hypothetical protein EYC84_006557 [Monilinia fructicola]
MHLMHGSSTQQNIPIGPDRYLLPASVIFVYEWLLPSGEQQTPLSTRTSQQSLTSYFLYLQPRLLNIQTTIL